MAREFGWAYVAGSQASGPKGSIQLAGQDVALDHDPNLLWSDDLNALLVSGNIIAHNFEIQNQTQTVFHFEVSGSSVFGDTEDDIHQFTGSLDITGNVTASNYYGYGGDLEGVAINQYTNHGDNRLITSIGEKSVHAEDNLLFDGSLLSVTGNVQAIEMKANELSGTLGIFEDFESEAGYVNELTSSTFSASVANIPNSTFGDIILTGRIVDANGQVILGTTTAQTEVNISNTGVQTSISSNTFPLVNSSNAVGMQYAVVEQGIEVGTNAFVAKLGAMGVGTNMPQARVEIFKEGGNQLRLSSLGANQLTSGGGFLFVPQKHHTDLETDIDGMFSIMPTGQRVGINTTTPEYSMDISGDTRITGDLIVSGALSAKVTNFSVSADTLTLGDDVSDDVIMRAGTMATPNGLVIDDNLFIDGGTIGVGAIATSKFGVTSTSNQLQVGNGTQSLSVSVTNGSTSISTNNSTIDIGNNAKVLGELVVGSNGDIVLDNAGQLSSSVSISSHSGYFTNLTSSTITNGNTVINGENIVTPTLDATTVNSTNLGGTLSTAAQPNVTSLGTLTSLNVANAANIGGPLAINKSTASKMVEIKDSTDSQLRLTSTEAAFGISEYQYVDFKANISGDLEILPRSGKVIIPQLNLTNVQTGASNNFLSLDSSGNVILSPAVQSGIEVRNRTVVSGSYQVANDDYFVGVQAAQNLTITLPDASTLFNGQIMVIKDELENADQYTITIATQVPQLIENRSSVTFTSPGSAMNIYCDGQSKFFIM